MHSPPNIDNCLPTIVWNNRRLVSNSPNTGKHDKDLSAQLRELLAIRKEIQETAIVLRVRSALDCDYTSESRGSLALLLGS